MNTVKNWTQHLPFWVIIDRFPGNFKFGGHHFLNGFKVVQRKIKTEAVDY